MSLRADSRRFLNRWWSQSPTKPKCRFQLQAMEERLVPATFQVTSNGDSGINTLRGALIGAGITIEADTIEIGVTGTILLTTGELKIPGNVTINGPTTGTVTVHGGSLSRVFNTVDAPAGSAININRVAVLNGLVAGSGAGMLIGDESVTLTECSFNGNKATGDGGGIHVIDPAGSLTLNSCFLALNEANGVGNDGGAISFQLGGTLVMDKSALSGNSADDDGGGIYFRNGGKFTITNSTINSNAAGSSSTSIGGGLYFFGTASGPLVMQNCTISGNQSGGAGGGIVLANFTGGINLVSCTITKNNATAAGITGGGLARTGGSGAVGMTSTIVAGNTSQSGNGPDVSFNTVANVTGTNNVIGVGDTSNALFDANNQLGTKAVPLNAKLGNLAYNGGPTATHRPLSGSPVIDKGTSVLDFDQRGVSRIVGKSSDVGSVEFADSFLVSNANDNGAGSLRRAVSDSNLDQGIFNGISFDATFFATPQTINLIGGEMVISEGLNLVGPSIPVTVDAGGLSRHFNIDINGSTLLAISDMKLINGKAESGGSILLVDSTLILDGMTFSNNVATTSSGGAINFSAVDDDLIILDSQFSNNKATAFFSSGGAIYYNSDGKLEVNHSRVTNNTSFREGGGIYATTAGELLVRDSTIDDNIGSQFPVQTGGGGIFFNGQAGTGELLVLNSTVSGNTSSFGVGGGITLSGNCGDVAIYNSTITGNQASTKGGGIYSNGEPIGMISSIVSGNSAGQGKDLFSTGLVSNIQCAVGTSDGVTTFGADAITQSLLGADFKLGPLTNNGGTTPTHLPANDSPLINKGTMFISLSNDQRGDGYMRTRSGKIDIGAVEANTPLVVTNADDSGPGSLRQAVVDANALLGPDTITFDPTFFNNPRLITLTTGQMKINQEVVINGPGATLATISGNNIDRIFNTSMAVLDTPITISGLTLTGGKALDDGGFDGGHGGAISVSNESLILVQCVLTGNTAPTGSGGAVAVRYGGTITATDCTFSNNSALFSGGAIATRGGGDTSITMNRCTVSGNQARSAGGIYMYRHGLMENSTISGNTATGSGGGGYGGGIHFATPFSGVTFTVRNSTISGNKAETNGGGLHLTTGAALIIENCTIVGNQAVTGVGGGIHRGATGTTNIQSSIIANNVNASAPDIASGGTVNLNYSALGNANGLVFAGGNNLPVGIDLKIAPLANNGGGMLTHRLQPGSTAINAGDNPAGLSLDQCGAVRVQGPRADIGAVESPAAAHVASVTVNDDSAQRSKVTSLTIRFDRIVHLTSPGTTFKLQRQSDGANVGLNVGSDEFTTEVLLTFNNGPLDFGSLADGKYTLTVNAAGISGGYFDGNGDDVSGDAYVLAGTTSNKLFRLFGDADGNGTVNALDFASFRSVFGLSGLSIFDFNGDNQTNAADFAQFRARFGLSI